MKIQRYSRFNFFLLKLGSEKISYFVLSLLMPIVLISPAYKSLTEMETYKTYTFFWVFFLLIFLTIVLFVWYVVKPIYQTLSEQGKKDYVDFLTKIRERLIFIEKDIQRYLYHLPEQKADILNSQKELSEKLFRIFSEKIDELNLQAIICIANGEEKKKIEALVAKYNYDYIATNMVSENQLNKLFDKVHKRIDERYFDLKKQSKEVSVDLVWIDKRLKRFKV